ncbi:bifunctional protein-serine/threonine kinase/phosphatase [Bowmanella denitrificans]|uniref:Bifunctional protein-serine/threonine kinase/phosphatase n=1 Tax=Bowmanella denitrificans TaxID=366582 RepID=A0ABN0XBR3_9ALTE
MSNASAVSLANPESQADTTGKLDLCFGGASLAGQKVINDDAFAAHLPSGWLLQIKGGVACIADGASHTGQGQQAAQLSVQHFIQDYLSTPDSWPVKTSAARILTSLNNWLYHHGRQAPGQMGMLTTFSALICKSNTAHLLHVGDSRIYRYRGAELELLTIDHRLNRPPMPLCRALGMDNYVEVDYRQTDLKPGDVFLLCTDGVHDVLPDVRLKALLGNLQSDLEAGAQSIVDAALTAGSADNISALLLRINSLPQQDEQEILSELTSKVIPPVLQKGMTLDGFVVRQVLHHGMRSHVYLVSHKDWPYPLVLKAPALNHDDDAVYLDSFIKEQWVATRLQHKGIMKMYSAPPSRFLYHLCEYLPGQTLRQWMQDHPSPTLGQIRPILTQLIDVLRVLQRQGMVHRDLRPENIIIGVQGQLTLLDFGAVQVAGWQEAGAAVRADEPRGAMEYSAPECLLGQQASMYSDQFSLAVLLYELFSGKLPFSAPALSRSSQDKVTSRRYHSLTAHRPDLPAWLDLVLQKATRFEPRQRYAALSEFAQDLTQPSGRLLARQSSLSLLERQPVRFWQAVSVLLALLLVCQWLM